METAAAEALMSAEPAGVYSAVLGLVGQLWAVTDAEILDARPGQRLVHSVQFEGETNCWLTWELSAVGPGATRVRLAHNEADLRPGPEPDLDQVLAALRSTLTENAATG